MDYLTKKQIQEDYQKDDDISKSSSSTLSLVIFSFVILLVFIAITILFYYYLNPKPTVDITIVNNQSSNIVPFVGALNNLNNNYEGLFADNLLPGQQYRFKVTIGFKGIINNGFGQNPQSSVKLELANDPGTQVILENQQNQIFVYDLNNNQYNMDDILGKDQFQKTGTVDVAIDNIDNLITDSSIQPQKHYFIIFFD